MEKAIIDLANIILYLGGFEEKEISVFFGDSIIEDTQSLFNRAMEEFKSGIITKDEYLNKVYKINKDATGKKE